MCLDLHRDCTSSPTSLDAGVLFGLLLHFVPLIYLRKYMFWYVLLMLIKGAFWCDSGCNTAGFMFSSNCKEADENSGNLLRCTILFDAK